MTNFSFEVIISIHRACSVVQYLQNSNEYADPVVETENFEKNRKIILNLRCYHDAFRHFLFGNYRRILWFCKGIWMVVRHWLVVIIWKCFFYDILTSPPSKSLLTCIQEGRFCIVWFEVDVTMEIIVFQNRNIQKKIFFSLVTY